MVPLPKTVRPTPEEVAAPPLAKCEVALPLAKKRANDDDDTPAPLAGILSGNGEAVTSRESKKVKFAGPSCYLLKLLRFFSTSLVIPLSS